MHTYCISMEHFNSEDERKRLEKDDWYYMVTELFVT